MQVVERAAAKPGPTISKSDLDRRVAFLEQLGKAFEGIVYERLYFRGAIPPEKAEIATKSYAPNVPRDAIMLLYDETALGGAKDGILLTVDSLYWHNLWGKSGHCRFKDIKVFSVKKDLLGNTKLVINAEEIFVSQGPSDQIAQAMVNLIRSWKTYTS